MATTIGNQITLDGTFGDWPANSMIMTAANAVAGYQMYGALLDDATLGETYVIGIDATSSSDAVIAAGTVIYLNTDQDNATGYSPSGVVGAEYEVQFALDASGALQAYLYAVTDSGATTLLNDGAPLDSGFSANGESVEVAIPQTLLTPAGGTAPTAIDFSAMIYNGSTSGAATTALPGAFAATTPQYVIPGAAADPSVTIANTIALNGTFTDFPSGDMVMTSANTVAGYQVYGALLNDATLGNTYVIGIDATSSTDPAIAAGTTIYLNTDQNTATGYSPSFAAGKVGAEYEVVFAYGSNSQIEPFLYSITSAGVTTALNGGLPLAFGFSSNGESVEVAIPQSLLTPSGGAAPTAIDFAALVNNAQGLPGDLNANPEYVIAAPTTATTVSHAVKKVGIVYSATTAALYYGGGATGETAYADLFMAAQQQARAAGVSYDLLTEADLTNAAKLSQYSALIFPDFQDVQSSQVTAIESTLQQLVQSDNIPIITSGDFMTNDQNGIALAGNSYASMENLLNLAPSGYGTATYSVQPDPTALASNNPILSGYTFGELIGGASGLFAGTTAGYYTNTGYTTFQGYTAAATTIADIVISNGSTTAGVVQSSTGSTDFATTGLFGDSNLLQHVIQNAVFGSTPSLSMDITRFKGILNSRTDMDQSQYPSDVSPATGSGIYNELIPILQNLYNEYDFVGTYFINVGDDANTANNNYTNWSVSTPYYDQILEMGNEIGDHSYTHLIDPPSTLVPATTTEDSPAGSTQITVSALPEYNGSTLDMIVTDPSNPGAIGDNTIVSAVTDNSNGTYTLTLMYEPAGYGGTNEGVLADIPAGTTLDFGIPTEDTNFLGTGTGTFTYAYEFGQSKAIEQSNIGITVAGAAVPGENDYLLTSEQILPYFPTTSDVTGYVSGGWTGVGSGSPNAIGYITPSETSSVYIAPNITFDFSEIQYEDKTPASSLADWESLFTQLSANSATPIIVWPWHDYGITDFPTGGPGTAPPGYSEALYANYIQYAYSEGYEFVTSEDLAQRVAAEQAATISESTGVNASGATVISASVTPSASEPDLGAMALNVINGAAGQVIQNAGSWYAYDTTSVFLTNDAAVDAAPETFAVTLGATQDNVTHVDYLPMRADLLAVAGDGTNLTFSFTGSGEVDVALKTPTTGTDVISVETTATGTGAGTPTATLSGDDLTLTFNDGALAISSTSPQGVPVLHDVTITEGATAVAGATFVFAPPTVAIAGAGGLTNQKTQTITGTVTEASESQVVGTTVTLFDNASTTALGAATVQAGVAGVDGGLPTWTATVTLTGDGTNSIVASDTDASDLTGSSAPVVYTLDTVSPTVAITTAGGTTNQTAQTIAGTVTTGGAAVGSTVTLTDNGKTVGTAAVSDGAWSTTVTLSAGSNSIVASDTDAAGNTGASAAATFTLDTVPPTVAITTAGGTTNQTAQTIAGTVTTGGAAVGSTVTLTDNGKTVGTAAVSDGAWSTTVTLSAGSNSIVASDTDAAGNTGASAAATFTLDTVPPTVAITTAGGTTNQTAQTIAGTVTTGGAAVGSTVTLTDNGKTVGTAAVSDGAWSTTVTLSAGSNSIVASDTDAAGNTGASAAATFTLDTVPPTVAITTAGGTTNQTAQTIAGTVTTGGAAVGSTVTLTDNGKTVGTAAVSDGAWSTTVTLSAGSNSIVASDTDAAGNTGASAAATFTLDTVPPTVAITTAGGTTNQTAQTIAGTVTTGGAAVGSTVTLTDNGKTVGTAAVSDGAWSTTVTLSAGSNSIVVSDTDAAGNTGASAAATFTLDTVPPTVAITTAGGTTNQTAQTIAGTVTTGGAAVGSTVTLTDNGKTVGTAAVSDGAWSTTVTLSAGSNSIVASDTDAAGNTGASAAATFTLDTVPPTVAITTAGGTTNQTAQTIAGTVTTGGAAVGSTVTLTDNGKTVGTAAVSDGAWSTTVTLSAGSNSIVASDTDAAGNTGVSNAVAYTVATSAAAPAITSETYSGSGATAHWVLGGTASAGATVTVDDGATALGTATAAASGAWTFTTAETNGAIRVYTATAGAAASAPVYEGTTGNDVFTFASEAAVSAAALINGDGGTDTLQLSSAAVLSDADFAHVQAIQILGLTGASGVTLGTNASKAGVTTITAGAGATSVTDSMATAGTLFVNAAALASNSTLTVAGSGAVSVTSLAGALVAAGDAGALTVTATGSATQSITTGSGNATIADSATGGGVTVNATAMGSTSTLTLAGAATETVTGLAATNLMAANLTGALSVTTKTTSLSIAAGMGGTTVDAGAMTGTLKLTGPGAVTVTALSGALDASADAGALKVTTTGSAPQTVTTGSGSIAITDASTGALAINAGSLASTSTLTLSGSGAATVSNLTGALDASGDTGPLAITGTGAGATIRTGGGTDTVTASKGGNTIYVSGKDDSIAVTGHTAADSFVYSETSVSPNTNPGSDTITGFAAGKSINDLLNVSAINPGLTIQGALPSGTDVAADSIAWLYSGGAAMVYVNDTTGALSTSSTSLMAIELSGLSSGLSASNFKA